MNLRQQIAHLKQAADQAGVPPAKVLINFKIRGHDAARLEQITEALGLSSRTEAARVLLESAILEAADELGLTAADYLHGTVGAEEEERAPS